MKMLNNLRSWLRRSPRWVHWRRLHRLGWAHNWRRWRIAPRILATRSVSTRPLRDQPGTGCEVHVLTWDMDWMMALWAAKTFYHYAGVDWPLVWHEGGSLAPSKRVILQQHFPQSRILTAAEATARVEADLTRGGFFRCLEARRRSFMLMKLIDCVVLSRSPYLLLLDSDVLFFQRPKELLDAVSSRVSVNLFNRDIKNWYNVSPAAARARYGLDLFERINAGLGLVRRESLALPMLEEFLGDPDILSDPWLTEQTLQALCGSMVGVGLLPDTYLVSQSPGLTTPDGRPLVSKHYPGFFRHLLYEEGMAFLAGHGFLEAMRCPR